MPPGGGWHAGAACWKALRRDSYHGSSERPRPLRARIRSEIRMKPVHRRPAGAWVGGRTARTGRQDGSRARCVFGVPDRESRSPNRAPRAGSRDRRRCRDDETVRRVRPAWRRIGRIRTATVRRLESRGTESKRAGVARETRRAAGHPGAWIAKTQAVVPRRIVVLFEPTEGPCQTSILILNLRLRIPSRLMSGACLEPTTCSGRNGGRIPPSTSRAATWTGRRSTSCQAGVPRSKSRGAMTRAGRPSWMPSQRVTA